MSDVKTLIRKLTEEKEHFVTVLSLDQGKDTFTSNGGQTKYCHFFSAQSHMYDVPVELQWCNDSPFVTEFKVGETIKVLAKKYVPGKGRQSVQFVPQESHQVPPPVSLPAQSVGALKNSKGEVYNDIPRNANPSIMGSLWSICMGHAVQFYKDRKDGTEEKVILFAEKLMKEYKIYSL